MNYRLYLSNNLFLKSLFSFLFVAVTGITSAQNAIKGTVLDAKTKETLPGVTILIKDTNIGTSSDLDGNFELKVSPGTYTLTASYLSYSSSEIPGIEVKKGESPLLNILLEESSETLAEVTIVAVKKMNSEVSLLNSIKNAMGVAGGISSQQISKNRDQDAAEAIKRTPGISIIDDKFVITRGLSQRYNNVWINNTATPASEADTRSFSFDLIPSSQIDNILIIKSPQPELPADFTGGFIKITTKSILTENSFQISYGTGFNSQTLFKNFKYNKGSSTDFLGFDNGKRSLRSAVPERADEYNTQQVTDITRHGFNNDWTIHTRKPIPDQRLGVIFNRHFSLEEKKSFGLMTALNYTYSTKTYTDMENSRFGIYNAIEDKPEYLYKYSDNQYNTNVRVGGMANLLFMAGPDHKFEFRNIFNRLARDRYTERNGWRNVSSKYIERKDEYIYTNRLTYTGQFSGSHLFSGNKDFDWTAGFSYANKDQPDRRIIEWQENTNPEDERKGQMRIDQNDITRTFSKLNEYAYSFTGNYKQEFTAGELHPSFKTGIYVEYKDREYKNRNFYYRWKIENLPTDFAYRDVASEILIPANFDAEKLYIYEDTDNRDSYSGTHLLPAGYVGINLPWKKFNIYTGVRIEHSNMKLKSYTSIKEYRTQTKSYTYTDIFPSVNATYHFDKKNLVRFAYGKSVNRQEFREISSSIYYDFDLFSHIKGNPDLKPAYIQNLDLRYEWYPSPAEVISLACFYKKFKNPIEWTYLDAGGSYTYTFENAKQADNYGIELDIKKNLGFIGLNDFSLTFNGALIHSNVEFDKESEEHDRPMQGQSPFLVNTGLFYQYEKLKLNIGLLYNIIGKRIVGIGKVASNEGSIINNDIPDMYEMPRHTFDISFSKKWGEQIELGISLRDLLAQKAVFKQFPKYYNDQNELVEREQITKQFSPGRTFSLTAKYTF